MWALSLLRFLIISLLVRSSFADSVFRIEMFTARIPFRIFKTTCLSSPYGICFCSFFLPLLSFFVSALVFCVFSFFYCLRVSFLVHIVTVLFCLAVFFCLFGPVVVSVVCNVLVLFPIALFMFSCSFSCVRLFCRLWPDAPSGRRRCRILRYV